MRSITISAIWSSLTRQEPEQGEDSHRPYYATLPHPTMLVHSRGDGLSSPWSYATLPHPTMLVHSRGDGLSSPCFDALYQQYYPAICAFLHFLVGTPEVAEDLASLVFEKVWTHLDNIRAQDTAGPWLFRIARNCATDYFRRCKPTLSLEHLLPAEHPQTASLEDAALAHEEERILLAHLSQLSEREREVIGLKFVLGMTNREIARILELPEGTVSSLLYRALRRLRSALNAEGGDDEA